MFVFQPLFNSGHEGQVLQVYLWRDNPNFIQQPIALREQLWLHNHTRD